MYKSFCKICKQDRLFPVQSVPLFCILSVISTNTTSFNRGDAHFHSRVSVGDGRPPQLGVARHHQHHHPLASHYAYTVRFPPDSTSQRSN